LAFFSFIKIVTQNIFKRMGFSAEKSSYTSFILCVVAIFWIWKLQDFRIGLMRPILTFFIRYFFKHRGAAAKIALPLLLTFLSECMLSHQSAWSEAALHYYLSVGGALLAYHLYLHTSFFRRHIALAIGSWLPIALISLLRDHLVSYMTPFYSLITIPVVSMFLYPLTLFDLMFHHAISNFTVSLWRVFLKFLFAVPDTGATFASISRLAIYVALPLAIAGAAFWPRFKKTASFWIMIPLSLCLGRFELEKLGPKHEVIQLDVHQGDSAIIHERQANTVEMIDVGSLRTYPPDQWIKKLSSHDVQAINGILLTHLDEDHVGALKELLLLVPIQCVETHSELWSSERGLRLQAFIQEFSPHTLMKSEGCIRLSEVGWFKSHKQSGNELMGGLVYAPGAHRAYLALGDGDAEQELEFESHFKNQIDSHPFRIWKVGHHGSRFSSNLDFLKRLDPEEFWISVGKHNPYHHPSFVTLEKLNQMSGKTYRTDVDGDIVRSLSE